MALNSVKIKQGILNIEPGVVTSLDVKGDIRVKSSGHAEVHDGSQYRELVDTDSVQTLSNKTFVGAGDVTGPASAQDNSVARFDGTTGKIIQDSGNVKIDDANVMTGLAELVVDNLDLNGNTINATTSNLNLTTTNGDIILQGGTGGQISLNGAIANGSAELNSITKLDVDNLELDGNTVSTTNTNGDLNLSPNGTGKAVSNKRHQFNSSIETVELVDSSTTGSDQDVANPTKSYLKVTDGSLVSIRSFGAGQDGQQFKFTNDTGASIDLKNEDAGATAANRIITGTGADLSLPDQASLDLIYDNDSDRWRVVGGTGGGTSGPNSAVYVSGDNGHGSAGTSIRCFTTQNSSVGSDITYTPDTTNGDYFTINTTGKYSLMWVDRYSGGVRAFGFSRNQGILTDIIQVLPIFTQLIYLRSFLANGDGLSTTADLQAGDVVRFNDGGNADNSIVPIASIVRVS